MISNIMNRRAMHSILNNFIRRGKKPNLSRLPRIMGRLTKQGAFVLERNRVPVYKVPDLTGFKVCFYTNFINIFLLA